MKLDIAYRPFRPAGYTDDLGIISDRNQWVDAQRASWYIHIHLFDKSKWSEIKEWLHTNNIYYEVKWENLILFQDEDVVFFKLRWN